MTRRAVVAVLVVGLLVGGAAALLARGGAGPSGARAGDPRPAPAQRGATLRRVSLPPIGRTRDGRYDPGRVHLRILPGTTRTVATAADPEGGDRWALRRFDADRITLTRPQRTLRGGRVVSESRCYLLGRIRDGRFGWVYGDGRFVRGRRDFSRYQCGSRIRPVTGVRRTTVARAPLSLADPQLAQSVVWGIAPGVRDVRVGGRSVVPGTEGAVLAVVGADDAAAAEDVRLDGASLSALVPGSTRVAVRAPDPVGGAPYGLPIADSRAGYPCVSPYPSRVIDGRAGSLDRRTTIFTPNLNVAGNCRPPAQTFTDADPCSYGTTGGGTRTTARGRTVLRQPRGGFTVGGSCSADVARVILRSPNDVRTLTPSRDGRAFLAVYGGGVLGGALRVEMVLRDRSRRVRELRLMP